MSENVNPSSSIRLLVKDASGQEIAVPLNDDLMISSGAKDFSDTGAAEERLRAMGVTYGDLKNNNRITTLNRGAWDKPVVLGLSIKEIFARVAKAQKSQKALVDLTAHSGAEALVKKVLKTSRRTMGDIRRSSPGIDMPVPDISSRGGPVWTPKMPNGTPAVPDNTCLTSKDYTILIDGSGSMNGNLENGVTLAKASVAAVGRFSKMTKGEVKVGFWGDKDIIFAKNIEDLKIFDRGLNSGTDFVPAVEYMQKLISASKKPQHFVVLSDGEFWDKEKSLVAANMFLTQSPKSSIDFIVLLNNDAYPGLNQMQEFAKVLQTLYPAQVRLSVVSSSSALNDSLLYIAENNISDAQSPCRTPSVKKSCRSLK